MNLDERSASLQSLYRAQAHINSVRQVFSAHKILHLLAKMDTALEQVNDAISEFNEKD